MNAVGNPPLPKATGASKATISKYAEDIARAIGYGPDRDLADIVKSQGGHIEYLLPDASFSKDDGSLEVFAKKSFVIKLSALTGIERDRFTIAHELGHYFLHYINAQGGVGAMTAKRSGSDRCEWEANWFAAAFLMPAEEFKRVYSHYGKKPNLTAIYFKVSARAAEVRCESLGLG